MERALGRRNRAEILGCVLSLQALEMGKISLRPYGRHYRPPFRNNRRLYFHSIDSVKQSWVETADLRNQSLWQNNMNAAPRAFHLFNGTRSSQSAAATMTKDGIMFFGLLGSNEIACWDSRTRFTESNIVSLAKSLLKAKMTDEWNYL
ncbi:cuticle pigmentation [Homalodisca vitripennis]|nr:cuticle pigmentation [Homalodisca vitripennis]